MKATDANLPRTMNGTALCRASGIPMRQLRAAEARGEVQPVRRSGPRRYFDVDEVLSWWRSQTDPVIAKADRDAELVRCRLGLAPRPMAQTVGSTGTSQLASPSTGMRRS